MSRSCLVNPLVESGLKAMIEFLVICRLSLPVSLMRGSRRLLEIMLRFFLEIQQL